MNRVKHIEIDLNAVKIVLRFQNAKDLLTLHFDTPSRKFYLSLIALIVHDMKQQDHSGYVYIRKHERILKSLDDSLAGSHASKTLDGMWEKIRKAWHYSLPNLEEAAHFKIEGRDLAPPFEKGGKYRYECTESECDLWSSLFGVDDVTNKWRFKFAFDLAGIDQKDVTLKFADLSNDFAWNAFLKDIAMPTTRIPIADEDAKPPKTRTDTQQRYWGLIAVASVLTALVVFGAIYVLHHYMRPATTPTEEVQKNRPSLAVLPFINISNDPAMVFLTGYPQLWDLHNDHRFKELKRKMGL